MGKRGIVRALLALGIAAAVALSWTGCGGDDGGESGAEDLTPETVASNLEAAGYGDVEVSAEEPFRPCDGFEDEVFAYTDPEGKTVQASVQFFESEEAATAAEECVIKGVTQYCSQVVEDRVYSLDCFKQSVTEEQTLMGALVSASQGD